MTQDPKQAEVVILHDEPWTYQEYFRQNPWMKKKYVIGYAVWEGDRPPVWLRLGLEFTDEIWTASRYCAEAFQPVNIPVFVIPHVVDEVCPDPRAIDTMRRRLGYQDGLTYFYAITKPLDVRKNLAAALRCYARVAQPLRNRMILKVNGGLTQSQVDIPGVVVVHESLHEHELWAIHRLCHVLISAHCSEGWGLTMSEAMAAGRLVVATGYGGNMEFMNESNSLPCAFKLETIHTEDFARRPDYWPSDTQWAYVDEADMEKHLRFADRSWPETLERREQARIDMRQYSLTRVAPILEKRLKEIEEFGYAKRNSP